MKLCLKPALSLFSFTFVKMLFSSSSLSAIRVVSSAYLRWLIFLPAILIPVCVSSSPAFLMMYCAYRLNKQGDNIQPWRTPFPIWNQPVVPCPVLTVASWPAYRFLKRRRKWQPTPVILPGKFHGLRSLVGYSPWGRKESDTTERLHFHFSLSCIGEGNGTPLQYSCLENPMDRGAW